MDTLAIFGLGPSELLLIGVVAVLIFGRRLPDVGRDLGRTFTEFKRGLREVKDDVADTARTAGDPQPPAQAKDSKLDQS